ncbi:MAG: GNAT family N-acetyltransferase [Myxococcota bacterium]
MCAVDHVAGDVEDRRGFIRRSVREGTAYVAILNGTVAGYAVLEHSFFERGFITMLMVGSAYRRRGVGAALVCHVEGLCESERIFTSTNQSNLPMRLLLQKLGYRHSGTVDDLDRGDPELFYSKQLT